MGDEKLVMQLTRNFSRRLFVLKFVLILLAIAAGVIAATGLGLTVTVRVAVAEQLFRSVTVTE